MRLSSQLRLAAWGVLAFAPVCHAQKSEVKPIEIEGRKATQIKIDLQAPQ